MDEKMIRELVKKSDLIKYCFNSVRRPLWCATYIIDDVDREHTLNAVMCDYDLDRGVYFYKAVRNQFRLIGIVKKGKVKML